MKAGDPIAGYGVEGPAKPPHRLRGWASWKKRGLVHRIQPGRICRLPRHGEAATPRPSDLRLLRATQEFEPRAAHDVTRPAKEPDLRSRA